MNFTLVMTAAVNVNGMSGISEGSKTNREQQYINTLKFYSEIPEIKHILFVENSAWDLTRIKASVPHPEKVSWISMDENNFPREWGKGYGEFLLMDRAIDQLINVYGEDYLFIKVTGRFPILNIQTMLKEFKRRMPIEMAIDIKDHPFYEWLHLGWSGHGARTILYAMTCRFYKSFVYGRYKEIPIPFPDAETFMFHICKQTSSLPGVSTRFLHEPWLSGIAGSLNHCCITANNYDGLLAKTKRTIQMLLRRGLPFIKL